MNGFAGAAQGSLVLAIPVAVLAGLVSFLSPCVLPLVPGYLSYVTGLTGADLSAPADPDGERQNALLRGRLVLGALLFVLGFTVVFVSGGVLFGGLGAFFAAYSGVLMRIMGGVAIVLGLAFLGVIPFLARDVRIHRMPTVGLAAAPLLGVTFGLGWTPCMGPTLGVVVTLSMDQGTAGRGALLLFAYAMGLGLPFLLVALGFGRLAGALRWVRRHNQWVTRLGGAMLIVVGLLLVTGLWDGLVGAMRAWVSGFGTLV